MKLNFGGLHREWRVEGKCKLGRRNRKWHRRSGNGGIGKQRSYEMEYAGVQLVTGHSGRSWSSIVELVVVLKR